MCTLIKKSWGYERIVYNELYCVKELVYTKAISSSLHYHDLKHETFYVVSGAFSVEIMGLTLRMTRGDSVVLPPKSPHRVRCLKPGTILESSTHDDPNDCVRLVPSEV